jgi:recombinational DNA repair ATPase RecF
VDQPRHSVDLFTSVDGRDVGTVHRRKHARLALEAVAIRRERRRQELDRDITVEAAVARPEDFAHSALAQRTDDLVAAEPITRGSRYVGGILPDIIKSKRAARRPRDLAVLEVLEKALEKKAAKLAAVRRESERGLREMIRRWQALPPGERTNFLRVRLGRRGSAL